MSNLMRRIASTKGALTKAQKKLYPERFENNNEGEI